MHREVIRRLDRTDNTILPTRIDRMHFGLGAIEISNGPIGLETNHPSSDQTDLRMRGILHGLGGHDQKLGIDMILEDRF